METEVHVEVNKSYRRRTERVMVSIPIRVMCFARNTGHFTEDTHTVLVNRDGALIALKHRVDPRDTLRIINLQNLREADFCIVGQTRRIGGDVSELGVECMEKDSIIWGIDFPSPMEPGSSQAGALLKCQSCGKEALLILSLVEIDMLESAGTLRKPCDTCSEFSSWVHADVERPAKGLPSTGELTPTPKVEKSDGQVERRLHKRMALKLPILLRNKKGEQEVGRTEDISKGGLAVCLNMMLVVGEFVTVMCPFTQGTEGFEQKAEVRRRRTFGTAEKWLYGLRYISK